MVGIGTYNVCKGIVVGPAEAVGLPVGVVFMEVTRAVGLEGGGDGRGVGLDGG